MFPVAAVIVFSPKFKISDEVTGIRKFYTGLYTLRVVAGGTEVDSITTFDPHDNV